MGLDMFLFKRPKKSEAESQIQIGYWRKSNHIHAWFVNECQDGIDECQKTVIPKEKLEELLDVCNRVLYPTGSSIPMALRESIAESLLPTQEGFFFGSTDYDDGYFDDIKDTIEIIDRALKETDFEKEEVIYRSSW